jgi:hypothetical protein
MKKWLYVVQTAMQQQIVNCNIFQQATGINSSFCFQRRYFVTIVKADYYRHDGLLGEQ